MKSLTEISLSILTSIKKLLGKDVKFTLTKSNTNISHKLWDELLVKNVSITGKVNYKGFINEKKKLIAYTSMLSNNSPSINWPENRQLAYWINAYNAFTVLLITNNYPLKSIKDIGGDIPLINSVWDIKFFKIGSVDFDLNTIEHDILRKDFNEPRIHFAINCASMSCPKLLNKAYTEDKLESQLENQAIDFINSDEYNQLSTHKIELSKIFKWFDIDFKKNQTIKEYISYYARIQLEDPIEVDYLEYDWNLNGTEN